PAVVHRRVLARGETHELAAPRVDVDVAAHRAGRADARRVLEVPRARQEAIRLAGQRAHGTDVGGVAREDGVERAAGEGADLRAVTAVNHDQLRVVGDITHEAHAELAHDAALAVEHDLRPDLQALLEVALLLHEAGHAGAELEGQV